MDALSHDKQVERFNFVAYGSLLALLGAFASATGVLVDAIETNDLAKMRASSLMYNVLREAADRVPASGETMDFRKQLLEMLGDHLRYTDAILTGSTDRAASMRDISEGQLILDLAFKRLGGRLGIRAREE